MTVAPRIHHKFEYPRSKSAREARVKNSISRHSRINPDTTMGAVPERLGSSGTAKVPHITANSKGIPTESKYLVQLSECLQPHELKAASAESSSRNRRAKFRGCDPISYFVTLASAVKKLRMASMISSLLFSVTMVSKGKPKMIIFASPVCATAALVLFSKYLRIVFDPGPKASIASGDSTLYKSDRKLVLNSNV